MAFTISGLANAPAHAPETTRSSPVRRFARALLSGRTLAAVQFDLMRLRARLLNQRGRMERPDKEQLHFGCGRRFVPGWLNVDVAGSEFDIDLGCGALPWADRSFSAIVGQHVVEHLELRSEMLPLLRELRRTARPLAEIWLSCPDLEKVCRAYLRDRGESLLADRRMRFEERSMDGIPPQQMINVMFHQGGEHRNLFDFDLLAWALQTTGWSGCTRVNEAKFLQRFPEFPARNDDFSSLYVRAVAGP